MILLSFLSLAAFVAAGKGATRTAVVWIHGTLFLDFPRRKPPVAWESTKYYPYQPSDEKGMVKVNKETKIPRLFSKLYKKVSVLSGESVSKKFDFYTFGWDGKLSSRSRREWGEELYLDLEKIRNEYDELVVLAHSHGGNVALNLARAESRFKRELTVDKLVMFGTPVQSETSDYIDSKVFKHIYNIYSNGDMVQVGDVFTTKDFFSKRSFKDRKKPLPNNLTEIEVVVNGIKPEHPEFWILGKVPLGFYRSSFPLHPIPIAVFTPILTGESLDTFNNRLRVNIDKSGNHLSFIFKDKKSEKITTKQFNAFNNLKDTVENWIK